jgi:hypothetical protein
VKTNPQECGCIVAYEQISRSMFIREHWLKFCPTHDAEEKAFHAEAKRAHDEHAAIRSLTEELP